MITGRDSVAWAVKGQNNERQPKGGYKVNYLAGQGSHVLSRGIVRCNCGDMFFCIFDFFHNVYSVVPLAGMLLLLCTKISTNDECVGVWHATHSSGRASFSIGLWSGCFFQCRGSIGQSLQSSIRSIRVGVSFLRSHTRSLFQCRLALVQGFSSLAIG